MPELLIVEDEILVACHMQDILEDEGYKVAGIAPDLRSAEQFIGRPIDLALIDLNLRDGLTGPQIGRAFSANGVPVIFVTANPAQVVEGIERVIGVLTKPTDEIVLIEAVNYALKCVKGEHPMPPPGLLVANASAGNGVQRH